MAEQADELTRRYLLSLDGTYQRRFRSNSGMAWVSDKKLFIKKATTVRLFPGDVVLRQARAFHGMIPGWFDYIGWDSVVITQEMVGTTVAVFAGDEIKTDSDRLRPPQRRLGECLARMGGCWRVVRP